MIKNSNNIELSGNEIDKLNISKFNNYQINEFITQKRMACHGGLTLRWAQGSCPLDPWQALGAQVVPKCFGIQGA